MKKKVLLVDDSPVFLTMEAIILAPGPFEVVMARDGLEALAKAKSEAPDAILLDVLMPGLDGLAACAAIRAEPATSHIPILMVTACDAEHYVEAAFRNGCNGYVTKPVDRLELLTKLHALLGLAVPA